LFGFPARFENMPRFKEPENRFKLNLPPKWYYGSKLLQRLALVLIGTFLVLHLTLFTTVPAPTYNDQPKVIFLIISYPKNFKRRGIQRDHWLRNLPTDFKYKYIVGDPDLLEWDSLERREFDEEMRREKDILITKGYKEDYKTIGEKVYLSLDWATQFEYSNLLPYSSQYVVKTDDDILLKLDLLLKLFQSRSNDERKLYYGQVFSGMKPARTTRSKYFVSQEEYAGKVFPPYACGAFYMMTMDLVKKIAAISKKPDFKLFKLEDVHMGMLMHDLDIIPEDNKGTFECSIHYVPHNETLFVHDYTGYSY
jgi:beta-1,3-galactosyltransferase